MPKKYDLKVIQAYFDSLGVAQLGEATGKELADLLVTLDWHTDDDLHRTATNCLAWVRKRVKFKEGEAAGFSPSKTVKACVSHIEQEVLSKELAGCKDGSTRSDEEAGRAAKVAAKTKITSATAEHRIPQAATVTTTGTLNKTSQSSTITISAPQKKMTQSSVLTTSNEDRNDTIAALQTELATCQQQIMALYSELHRLHNVVEEMAWLSPFCRNLYEHMKGSGHGSDASGGQAQATEMMGMIGHEADACVGEAATATVAPLKVEDDEGLFVSEEYEDKADGEDGILEV